MQSVHAASISPLHNGDGRGDPRPRYNAELEQIFLGALMLDNRPLAAAPFLKPEHFGLGVHGRIFAVMADFIGRGLPADPVALKEPFEGDEALRDLLGGPSFYLMSLAKCAINGIDTHRLNMEGRAKQIMDLFRARQMLALAEDIERRAYDSTDPIERQVIDGIEALRKVEANGVDNSGLGEWDFGLDDTPIPPRAWLLGNIFCRRFVSSLVGPGAAGKTAIRIAQLLSLAVGRSLTGEHVFQKCRVLIVCLEDDDAELRRRLRAAMLYYDITQADLVGWLYIVTPAKKGWKIAGTVNGVHVEQELSRRLEASIRERKIDIVSLDPMVKLHAVDENSNNALDFVVTILTRIAVEHDCAVDVPHHVSKGAASAGNADRARGGSAAVDGFRLAYTLWPMSEKEAESFGIDENLRRVLVRMDSAKVNLAAPGAGTCWFKFVGVPIGNPTALYPHGDEVQTVEPWIPPATWGGASYAQLNEILTEIDQGMPDGALFSNLPRVGDRAAHLVVQKHLPDKTEGQAREIIKTWIKNKVLNYGDYQDPAARKPRKGLRLDLTKRPG